MFVKSIATAGIVSAWNYLRLLEIFQLVYFSTAYYHLCISLCTYKEYRNYMKNRWNSEMSASLAREKPLVPRLVAVERCKT